MNTDSEPPRDDLSTLTTLEVARIMPGMFYGGTDQFALHETVWGLIELAIEEILISSGSSLAVMINPENVVTVVDDGMGLPIDNDPNTNRSLLETSITTSWHVVDWQGRPKSTFRNLKMMGLGGINAVAEYLVIEIRKDGFLWQQSFRQGERPSELERVRTLKPNESTGTTIVFKPDFTLFKPNDIDYRFLYRRLREMSFFFSGWTISLEDRRIASKVANVRFWHPNGLKDWVMHINRNYPVLHDPIVAQQSFLHEKDSRIVNCKVNIAFQYAQTNSPVLLSFVNGDETIEGGTHIEGLVSYLEAVMQSYHHKLRPSEFWHFFARQDIVQGLAAIVSIWHSSPQFEGSLKTKLSNPDIKHDVEHLTGEAIEAFTEAKPDQMQRIFQHLLDKRALRERRRDSD